jgi:hypothetical protein
MTCAATVKNSIGAMVAPAQLALALAADVPGDGEAAQNVYQRVKFQLVGRFARDGWSLTEHQLRETIRDIQQRDQDRSP